MCCTTTFGFTYSFLDVPVDLSLFEITNWTFLLAAHLNHLFELHQQGCDFMRSLLIEGMFCILYSLSVSSYNFIWTHFELY
jgi:hypothetical protein